jgi:hypothetical protein
MDFSIYEKELQKQAIVDLISELALDGKTYELSNGSSIPNKFFSDLGLRFGVPVAKGMDTKAATICVFLNVEWTSQCDSSNSPSGGGGTVTKTGLLHLLAATRKALLEETTK